MSFINENKKEINCKIVYYGPSLCGKSTTLRYLYNEIQKSSKGEMISLAQDNDRTLYFDFMPLNLGKLRGYDVRLHLYTVPGEFGYQQSRALISKGVDAVVFIADSQLERMDANLKSLSDLKEVLKGNRIDFDQLPRAFHYNKRDLKGALPTSELQHFLNPDKCAEFETTATSGTGVFDAFKAITARMLKEMA